MRLEKFTLAVQNKPAVSEVKALISEILKLIDPLSSCLTLQQSESLNNKIHQVLQKSEINRQLHLSHDEKLNHVKGCLLWARLSQTIGSIFYDSYPSRILPLFPGVKTLTAAQQSSFKISLSKHYNLQAGAIDSINQEVNYVTSNLKIKNTIVAFILKQLSLGMSHAKLFKLVTGYSALAHQQIDVTITNATIFFSFEFDQAGLSGKTLKQCSLTDKSNVEKLFGQLKAFSNTERSNFPAVGKWQTLTMEPKFLAELSTYISDLCHIEVDQNILQSTIATMIYLVPHKDAESFFVHDAYGHSWQESLCEFEHLYRYLSRLTQPCPLEDHFESLKTVDNKDQLITEAKEFYLKYYEQQINIITNALLAEFTADAMEFHLQQKLEETQDSIPTSSKMRHFSLFLDLSLKDTIKHVSSLRAGIKKEFTAVKKQKLALLIKSNFISQTEAIDLVDELETWFKQSLAKDFYATEKQSLSLIENNLFNQLLKIYAPLDDYMNQNDAGQLQQLLLVLTTLYQSNPSKMFWQLDRYIKNYHFCAA